MNIKNVLALKFTGILASILLLFSLFILAFSSSFTEEAFIEKLKNDTKNLVSTLLDSNEVDEKFVLSCFKYNLNIFSKQTILVYDDAGNIFFKNKEASQDVIKYISQNLKDKNNFSFSQSGTVYVGFNYVFKNRKFYIITSAVDEDGHLKIKFLLLSLLALFVVSISVILLLGRFFAKQALLPMNKVISQVEKVTESNLNERVNVGNGKDEIALLAITFNQMLDRLENSFKLQKTFVSNASHEFRTPLTVMKGQIEVLLLQPRETEIYLKTFMSLLDDINNQIDLINGLASLANANANFPNSSLSNVSIIELLDECVSDLARNKKYQAVLNIEDLPDSENAIYLKGNHALLRSALMNVMDNACKFNNLPTCQVNLSCNEEFITITIIDQGLGISKTDLAFIFESFFRSNNTRHIQGHGIGLSLVKKIVDLHYGKINVTSELGKGTIMNIYFPNLNAKSNFVI